MKNRILVSISICFSVISFAQDNWQTFEKDNYSINYPATWEYSDQKPQPTIQFVLLSEETSQTEDMFRENINLNTEDLNGEDITIEAYTNAGLDQVMTQIPLAKILSKKDVKLDDKTGKEIIWSADLGNGVLLKFKQIFVINNGTAYVLTFTATEAEYDKYIDNGEKILYSFKFTK